MCYYRVVTHLFGSLDGVAGWVPDLGRRAGVNLIVQLKHTELSSSVRPSAERMHLMI